MCLHTTSKWSYFFFLFWYFNCATKGKKHNKIKSEISTITQGDSRYYCYLWVLSLQFLAAFSWTFLSFGFQLWFLHGQTTIVLILIIFLDISPVQLQLIFLYLHHRLAPVQPTSAIISSPGLCRCCWRAPVQTSLSAIFQGLACV